MKTGCLAKTDNDVNRPVPLEVRDEEPKDLLLATGPTPGIGPGGGPAPDGKAPLGHSYAVGEPGYLCPFTDVRPYPGEKVFSSGRGRGNKGRTDNHSLGCGPESSHVYHHGEEKKVTDTTKVNEVGDEKVAEYAD